MKSLLLGLCLLFVPLLLRAEDPGVLRRLPPEEFKAAGLDKLTPEELARLERIFQSLPRHEAAAPSPAVPPAARKVPAAETTGSPGWLRALITLRETEARPDKADPVRTRIRGEFKGWTGRTQFTFENGQVWQQTDGKTYHGPAVQAPSVRIYPGVLGVFWLEVEGVNQRVKVKPIRLE